MKKQKISIKVLIIALLIITIFSISIMSMSIKNEETLQLVSNKNLNNKKIGWGIKRNSNHEQPDVGNKNKEVLEKNNGICLGNKDKKIIYLTFDEGYEAGYTTQILEILKNNDVKATFFITAHYMNTQKDLVKQMIDEGHIVGNHTPKCLMSGNNIEVKCLSNSLFIANKNN